MLAEFRQFLVDLGGDADVDDAALALALATVDDGPTFLAHAPAGYTKERPLVLEGKSFVGGEFIPDGITQKATGKKNSVKNLAKHGYDVAAKFGHRASDIANAPIDMEVAKRAIQAIAAKAGAGEHAITEVITKNFAKLPGPIRAPLLAFLKLSFSTYIAGHRAATAVARERGGEENAERVGRMVMMADMAGAKFGTAVGAAIGGPVGAGLLYMAPIGSMSYLAYSTARDPAATLRAARKAVHGVLESHAKRKEARIEKRKPGGGKSMAKDKPPGQVGELGERPGAAQPKQMSIVIDMSGDLTLDQAVFLAVQHAPIGGEVDEGKKYAGGQFTPGNKEKHNAQAPEEGSKLAGSGSQPAGQAGAGRLRDQTGVADSAVGVESQDFASTVAAPRLRGLPERALIPGHGEVECGPDPRIRRTAADYMKSAGLPYRPPTEYVKVDKVRAKKIADAYDEMKDDPNDPQVKAAYGALIKEVNAQYEALLKAGLKVEFIDYAKQGDPYAVSPRLAIEDIKKNNHFWVFPSSAGFGSDATFDASKNPLLAMTGHKISGQEICANDQFRVVHDYFGHAKEGSGMRADGEENAWRCHSAMFSPLARRAMTSETRGQNSWVNFGPFAEHNKKASGADTKYVDQKVGLLPEWCMTEGSGVEEQSKQMSVVIDMSGGLSLDRAIQLAIHHAPAGGETDGGKKFKGGQFAPGDLRGKLAKMPIREFAQHLHDVAHGMSGPGVRSSSDDGLQGRKILISHLHREVAKRDPSMSLDAFKDRLVEGAQQSEIRLARNDLPQLHDKKDLAESVIIHPMDRGKPYAEASWHYFHNDKPARKLLSSQHLSGLEYLLAIIPREVTRARR